MPVTAQPLPKQILFENGAIRRVPDLLKERGASRVLVVSTNGRLALPEFYHLKAKLDELKIATSSSSVNPEPSYSDVSSCSAQAMQFKPDAIVGFGGGSPIDVAKAALLIYSNCEELLSPIEARAFLYDKARITQKKAQLIAIPTTAGSGSEATIYAVFYSEEMNLKKGVSHPLMMPDLAVIDSELLLSMPFPVAASTGLDTLCHAVESFTGRATTPLSDALALRSLEIAGECVYASCHGDEKARLRMAEASFLGGLAIMQADVTLPHALSYAFRSLGRIIPHGIACAVMLMPVFEFFKQAGVVTDRIKEALSLLAAFKPNPLDLLKELKMSTLTELGFSPADVPKLAEKTMELRPNESYAGHVEVTQKDVEEIYKLAF